MPRVSAAPDSPLHIFEPHYVMRLCGTLAPLQSKSWFINWPSQDQDADQVRINNFLQPLRHNFDEVPVHHRFERIQDIQGIATIALQISLSSVFELENSNAATRLFKYASQTPPSTAAMYGFPTKYEVKTCRRCGARYYLNKRVVRGMFRRRDCH